VTEIFFFFPVEIGYLVFLRILFFLVEIGYFVFFLVDVRGTALRTPTCID